MSRLKDLLLAAIEDGEQVPGWPPVITSAPPELRTPLGCVPTSSPRHFWPYYLWMRVGLTPYTRPTAKRGRRRRHHWTGGSLYR